MNEIMVTLQRKLGDELIGEECVVSLHEARRIIELDKPRGIRHLMRVKRPLKETRE